MIKLNQEDDDKRYEYTNSGPTNPCSVVRMFPPDPVAAITKEVCIRYSQDRSPPSWIEEYWYV